MALTIEQLKAFGYRTEEMAQQIARLLNIGNTAAQDLPDGEQRLYLRLSYQVAKAALVVALRDALAGVPTEPPLSKVDGYAIEQAMGDINKAVGYLRSLAAGLQSNPVVQEDGTIVVGWTDEQREAIKAELEAKAQEIKDALAALP